MKSRGEINAAPHLFIFILSLAAPFVLYCNRHLDDNRLTSWAWVFSSISLSSFAFSLTMVLALAWLLSRLSFYEKHKPLVLFGTAFMAASCFWTVPEVIVDSSRYFTQAKQLHVYGIGYFVAEWGKEIFAWTDLPLVPFLYGLVFEIFGEKRIFIQLLNTFFYAATVVLTYQLGKTLWNEDIGFWGGLLLLGFPYLYTQVPLLLVDVPTMFFYMLAVVTSVNALKYGGSGRIVLAGLALCCVFYVKYSTWMLLTLMPVIYVCFIAIAPGRTMRRGVALALLAAVLIGSLLLVYKDVLVPQLDLLLEYQKPGLQRWSESFISTFFFQAHPFITMAALFSLAAAVRKFDFSFTVVCFLIFLFLLLQIKRIRYTLPVFPMLALMASYGLEATKNRKLIKHLVFSVVFTSFFVAFKGFLPFLQNMGVANLQAAGNYLNTIPGNYVEVVSLAGDNVVVNPANVVPVLDIYTAKHLIYEYEPVSPEVLDRVKNSPLRFTWELPLPAYYAPKPLSEEVAGLVVIADTPMRTIPPDIEKRISRYPRHYKFHQSSNVFQHQAYVSVYHK